MPKVYRMMLADGEQPMVGDRKFMLGVRVGKPPDGDLELTDRNTVVPGVGGMSVSRHWTEMPYFLIPPRLRHLVSAPKKRRSASGNDDVRCWRMGAGEFADGAISENLVLRCDKDWHGVIEPANEIEIDQFQLTLTATRSAWSLDEEP